MSLGRTGGTGYVVHAAEYPGERAEGLTGGNAQTGLAPGPPTQGDRKGRPYYTRMNRQAKPVYGRGRGPCLGDR